MGVIGENIKLKAQVPHSEMAQLLTELRFLLEHSIESRKVSVKQYFSLLLKFKQQAAAKILKDYFHQNKTTRIFHTSFKHNPLLEIFLRVFAEYESFYLDTSEEVLWRLIDHLLFKISDFQYCYECFNWQIFEPIYISKTKTHQREKFYCPNCQNNVKIYNKFEVFPIFLEYLVDLSNETSRFKRVKKFLFKKWNKGIITNSKKHQNLIILLYEIFEDLYSYTINKSDINGIRLLWIVAEKIGFNTIFKSNSPYNFVVDHLIQQIEKGDFSDYSLCLETIQKVNPTGKNKIKKFLVKGGIEKNTLRAISTSNLSAFYHSFNFGINQGVIIKEEFISSPIFEAAFIRGLFFALYNDQLELFKEMIELIEKFGLIINLNDIPNRFSAIGNLLINAIKFQRVDRIFPIIQFGLNYELFNISLSQDLKKELLKYKNNKKIMNNIQILLDFDNNQKNELLFFIFKYLPKYFTEKFDDVFNFYTDSEDFINFISDFLNNFTFYGLSLKKIGITSSFIKKMKSCLSSLNLQDDEIKIKFAHRTILVSRRNFFDILYRIRSKPRKFEFLMLGMVLKGGLGPQGLGFIYVTPRGEIIEICSDTEVNKAYIVRFKQFLREDFINELESRITTLILSIAQKNRLIEILEGRLWKNQKVGITAEQFIFRQVQEFLEDEFDFRRLTTDEIVSLFDMISKKIHAILMPVSLIDQYRCRLDLVSKGKVDPGEIAKLTSLGDKSHYDLLQERYFYQTFLKNLSSFIIF